MNTSVRSTKDPDPRLLSSTRNLLWNPWWLDQFCGRALVFRKPYTGIRVQNIETSLLQFPWQWANKELRALMFYTDKSSIGDPWNFGTDPDPRIHASDKNKKYFIRKFFWLLLYEGTFTLFFKDKNKKKSQNSRNQDFSYHFCLMIEGIRIRTSD